MRVLPDDGPGSPESDGLEGPPCATPGLNLLPVQTMLKAPKTANLTRFFWNGIEGTGYEIHGGQTQRFDGVPLFKIHERNRLPIYNEEEGSTAPGGRSLNAYIHGLFDAPEIMKTWLSGIGLDQKIVSDAIDSVARDREYDLLDDHFKKYVDVEALLKYLDRSLLQLLSFEYRRKYFR